MSPSTSEPVSVKIVALAATVSRTLTSDKVPRTGASFTAVTIIETVFEAVVVPSATLRTKSPISDISLLTSAFGVKIKPSRFSTVSKSPAAISVPSARERVPSVGVLSTVIVKTSPSTSTIFTSNGDAVSSANEKVEVSRTGTSSTAVTVKEIEDVAELVPSDAVKDKLPKLFNSEFAFSSKV